jgi:hypothetical protein
VVEDIEFYSYDRTPPDACLFALWADPPGAGDAGEDADGDGMPNAWEDAHGQLSPYNRYDALFDYDGDGVMNVDEYHADTLPGDRSSYLHVLPSRAAGDGLLIRWAGGVLATQRLERSTDLRAWRVIFTNHPPTDLTNEFTAEPDGPGLFFRVRVNER